MDTKVPDPRGSRWSDALLIGPVLTREIAISPRRARVYVARTAYGLGLLVLMSTAWLVFTGTQLVRDVGDLARFGTILFQILAPLQLALAIFFSALLAASEVAHEKDRRTLILLLVTHLSNSELVLGKLLASLLGVLVVLCAGVPIFLCVALLGGVSHGQIARAMAITLATAICCGSLGSTLALWREKTFQSLAMTVLILVLWLAAGEALATGVFGETILGLPARTLAIGLSPWQAILEAARPCVHHQPTLGWLGTPVHLFLLCTGVFAVAINAVAIAMVRVWNPSKEAVAASPDQGEPVSTESTAVVAKRPLGKTRRVWDNPIVWREIRTWAYGRKILVVRLVYLLFFAISALALDWISRGGQLAAFGQGAWVLAPLMLLSLVLVNAQAVTSITSERDVRALDLLLVTDLTPKEIVYGKLGGVLYNTKEMVLLPMLLCAGLWWTGLLSLENFFYLAGGLAVLYLFAATVGLHLGMSYANSGAAVATSLGTIFFLSVGVAVCMRIMMAFSGSPNAQFLPFFAFMVFGGVGLYAVLGLRNPSTAIGWASFLCPFATFYAITSYLLQSPLAAFLVTVAAYGFTIAAMLVPAICEFDVATGRTTADE